MLNVEILAQTEGHCGPVCSKMVYGYYGKNVSEREIAGVAKTTSRYGTLPGNMVKAARHFGFRAQYRENLTWDELHDLVVKERVPVIVNWFDINEGHYSVAIDLDRNEICLADPNKRRRRRMSKKNFMGAWLDYIGSSTTKKRIRSAIIVRKR